VIKLTKQKSLKFHDMKTHKSFNSSNYNHVNRGKTKFAVAKNPSGNESWRIVGKK